MNKDKINEEFQKLYGLYKQAEVVKERPYDPGSIQGLESLIEQETKLPKPNLKGLPPDQISAFASGFQENLLGYVNKNVETLAENAINEGSALNFVLGLKPYVNSDKAKLVNEIQENIQLLQLAGKDPRIIELLVEELMKYDKKGILARGFAYVLQSADKKAITNFYQGLVAMKQRNLINKFSDKEGKLDVDAVKGYVIENIKATPDKEKQESYMQFADTVANVYQQQEAQKQAEAQKEG